MVETVLSVAELYCELRLTEMYFKLKFIASEVYAFLVTTISPFKST